MNTIERLDCALTYIAKRKVQEGMSYSNRHQRPTHQAKFSLNTLPAKSHLEGTHEFIDSSLICRTSAKDTHVIDTKRKTLTLGQKRVSGKSLIDEKSVELPVPDAGKMLDHHNAERLSEQHRRINHPHNEGS